MENKDNLQEELSSFRRQWHEELQQRSRSNSPQIPEEPSPTDNHSASQNQCLKPANTDESIENRAKYLFLTGVALEQKGRMPEAIRYYRQAIQLLPDIENRISDFNELVPKTESPQEIFLQDMNEDDEDGTLATYNMNIYRSKELECVVKEFDKMSVKGICEPEFPTTKTHISALPAELLMYIFKWVVSLHLDLRSLERLGQVCRGFYALARDTEIWRLACLRVWGVNLGSTVSWNGSWREMYLKRAHILYNGVYISKVSYTRPSEPTFEQHYTPYQLIIYYRYLRFFTDGSVLFLTSPDEPHLSIPRLSLKNENNSIWRGNCRLVGDKVLLVIQRTGYPSRRRGRRPAQSGSERVFHMELQLENTKKKRNNKLTWVQYTCQTFSRGTETTTVSQFDLNNEQFCPFYFSRVRSYETSLSAPLGLEGP
ncbi:F-box only protein 9-like [Dendronephthya gigantea]|uniref:F-box only protein 9-like n=1 Tax=Dendronephthya gigantea TaxID=151771 RepID=UPI00106B8CAE|nr:F-box only protein 9-like [Dendronephthya gigantea]